MTTRLLFARDTQTSISSSPSTTRPRRWTCSSNNFDLGCSAEALLARVHRGRVPVKHAVKCRPISRNAEHTPRPRKFQLEREPINEWRRAKPLVVQWRFGVFVTSQPNPLYNGGRPTHVNSRHRPLTGQQIIYSGNVTMPRRRPITVTRSGAPQPLQPETACTPSYYRHILPTSCFHVAQPPGSSTVWESHRCRRSRTAKSR